MNIDPDATEEQREEVFRKKYKFPKYQDQKSYFEFITTTSKITNDTKTILEEVEKIKEWCKDIEQYWTSQEFKNFFYLEKNIK